MRRYKALSGDAGVVAYESGAEFIYLDFRDGRGYAYTYVRPGREDVEEMKRLAASGRGLTTYVNKYVRDRYERRLH